MAQQCIHFDYGPNVVNRRILDFITENKDVPFFVNISNDTAA